MRREGWEEMVEEADGFMQQDLLSNTSIDVDF